jgi:AhpD family alkylhydroperoxidase
MERLDYRKIGAKAFKALGTLVAYVHDCGLDHSLLELVKLRASQINGCANCVDLHVNRARELGETEERLQSLVVWWESPCFTEREKAALAWTEAVTLVASSRVPDDVFARVQAQYSEQEIVDLTFAVVTINSHNRLAVAFRRVPGS